MNESKMNESNESKNRWSEAAHSVSGKLKYRYMYFFKHIGSTYIIYEKYFTHDHQTVMY